MSDGGLCEPSKCPLGAVLGHVSGELLSPIPPIPLLIPMCLAAPHKAFRYAMICAAGAVAGGFLGYAIGYLLYDTVGQWILALYGLTDKAQELVQGSQKFWFWVLLTKGSHPSRSRSSRSCRASSISTC